jgi:hypothetical protein
MSKRKVQAANCSVQGAGRCRVLALALGTLGPILLTACVAYESRAYLQPEQGDGFKVRTFGTGIPDTLELRLARNSTLRVTGERVSGGLRFEISLALDRGHSVRFANPAVRVACHGTRPQEIPIAEIAEGRISSGRGYVAEHHPGDELRGRTTTTDLDAPGDYSYGTYSFSVLGSSCGSAPYLLQLPEIMVDGVPVMPPQFTFYAARARKVSFVSPMN